MPKEKKPSLQAVLDEVRRTNELIQSREVILEEMRAQNGATIEAVETIRVTVEQRIDRFERHTHGRFTVLEAAIRETSAGIHQNSEDIRQNTADIRQNSEDIRQNTKDIRQNTSDIRQNTSDIRQNGDDIRALSAEVGALGSLDRRVSTLERRVSGEG